MDKLKDKVLALKKETILECATTYFETVGFDNTKISNIAQEVGMSVGAFYKIYESKDVLFNAYIIYQVGRFNNEYKTLIENETSYEEKLKIYLRLKFKYYVDKCKAIENSILSGDPFFYHKAYSGKENPMHQVYLVLMDIFEEVLPQKSKTDLKFFAYTFHAMSDGVISLWFEEKVDLDKQVDKIYDLFMKGVN